MKKLLLTALLAGTALAANAQEITFADYFRQRIAYGDDELHHFVYPELDLP